MTWTVAALTTTCGCCGAAIPQGEPMALLTAQRKTRCVSCAGQMGFAVDWAEIDQERFRREQDALHAAKPITRAPIPTATKMRRPVPLAQIAGTFFDFQMAAANDGRDD